MWVFRCGCQEVVNVTALLLPNHSHHHSLTFLPACLPSSFQLVLRLRGGGKRKKRKAYTTPKKNKHVHKAVKLAVLKYYKVDQDGKITRLRRECPHQDCGAGVFMARHHDRQYCGKCG